MSHNNAYVPQSSCDPYQIIEPNIVLVWSAENSRDEILPMAWKSYVMPLAGARQLAGRTQMGQLPEMALTNFASAYAAHPAHAPK